MRVGWVIGAVQGEILRSVFSGSGLSGALTWVEKFKSARKIRPGRPPTSQNRLLSGHLRARVGRVAREPREESTEMALETGPWCGARLSECAEGVTEFHGRAQAGVARPSSREIAQIRPPCMHAHRVVGRRPCARPRWPRTAPPGSHVECAWARTRQHPSSLRARTGGHGRRRFSGSSSLSQPHPHFASRSPWLSDC